MIEEWSIWQNKVRWQSEKGQQIDSKTNCERKIRETERVQVSDREGEQGQRERESENNQLVNEWPIQCAVEPSSLRGRRGYRLMIIGGLWTVANELRTLISMITVVNHDKSAIMFSEREREREELYSYIVRGSKAQL
jgi:hypothetical protein